MHCGLTVSVIDSGLSSPGLSPEMILGKTPRCIWLLENLMLGVTLQKTSIPSIQDLPTFPIHFHWNRMIKFLWDTLIIIPNHDLSTSYNILQCQCPSPGLGLNFTVHLTIGWYYFHFIF